MIARLVSLWAYYSAQRSAETFPSCPLLDQGRIIFVVHICYLKTSLATEPAGLKGPESQCEHALSHDPAPSAASLKRAAMIMPASGSCEAICNRRG